MGGSSGVGSVLDACTWQGVGWRTGFRALKAELIEAITSKM